MLATLYNFSYTIHVHYTIHVTNLHYIGICQKDRFLGKKFLRKIRMLYSVNYTTLYNLKYSEKVLGSNMAFLTCNMYSVMFSQCFTGFSSSKAVSIDMECNETSHAKSAKS
jgi:hypothetical protein